MDFNFLIVIVLLAMSVLVLVSGVANDAINFLNSAIGSRAGKFRTILIVAGIGVFVGVFASSGMMEIARKGIFDPSLFLMPELMIIFVAAMFQGFILLDTFNTFGLPTSTTVSIVFGLFGAALAMSIIKISNSGESYDMLFTYINTNTVIKIITGILLSIVFAFIIGSIVQFLTRLIFSFSYKESFRKYGALWSGVVLTALSFFIMLKGLKSSEYVAPEFKVMIMDNMLATIGILIVAFTIIIQILISFTKVNILRVIVLVGTFSLALAFAANDLVNFIGAPLAGFNAYNLATDLGPELALTTPMGMLAGKVPANNLLLFLSGVIMVATLFLNKKARTVAQTELSLGRQEEGYERFESNALARAIVRGFISITAVIKNITPISLQNFVKKQLDVSQFVPEGENEDDKQIFDLVRAAVILMVSAILISWATINKLPLSTTYVTFIVAMAAALPDKAWGRESAVYRISGVVTVVGGWFFTAIFATAIAMVISAFLYWGQEVALGLLVLLIGYLFYKSNKIHSDRELEAAEKKVSRKINSAKGSFLEHIFYNTAQMIAQVDNSLTKSVEGIITENIKDTRQSYVISTEIAHEINLLNTELLRVLNFEKDDSDESIGIFTEIISSIKDISSSTEHITNQIDKYVGNQHSALLDEQSEDLRKALASYRDYTHISIKMLNDSNFDNLENMNTEKKDISKLIKKMTKKQLKRIKGKNFKMRRSMLILNFYSELKNNIDHVYSTTVAFSELEKNDAYKNIPID